MLLISLLIYVLWIQDPSPVNAEPEYWLKDLDLTFHDKLILQSSQWLNDGLIFATQLLLKRQSQSGVCGLKSTQCANRLGKEKFPPIPMVHHIYKSCMFLTTIGLLSPTLMSEVQYPIRIVHVYMTVVSLLKLI